MGKGTRYPRIAQIIKSNYSGGRVLEIGAGVSPYANLFSTYIGSDIPGSKYAKGVKLDVYCDARMLPFQKNCFDFVFGVGTFYLIENPQKAFLSLWFVLKPGGKFLLFDYTEKMQTTAFLRHLKMGKIMFFNFWNANELRRKLQQSGFAGIKKIPYYSFARLIYRKIFNLPTNWMIFRASKTE